MLRLIPALPLFVGLLLATPARAEPLLDAAFDRAIAQFERAQAQLSPTEFGVDVAAYRDALTLRRFTSSHWGAPVRLEVALREAASGSCNRYAAFVRIPPENGAVTLVACPQFLTPGADALRTLTILHEMVHVVAGSNECRAMAFAARVEHLATGRHTPVEAYWRDNGCAGSGFSLP